MCIRDSIYPEAVEIINKDLYADDCMSGAESKELAYKRADEMEDSLNPGGSTIKGLYFLVNPHLNNSVLMRKAFLFQE